MATTAIWGIQKRSIRELIDYCTNPQKTDNTHLVSGINCDWQTAAHEMWIVKQECQKTGGILAYHGYQSFKPGEVTPETAHQIGLELAQKLWGGRFQIVVATHTDHQHIHNHFALNSVSFVDGKKYNTCKAAYRELQTVSDNICREHGLSVVEQAQGKAKHYAEWRAGQQNQPTWRSLIKQDVDRAIQGALTDRMFCDNLKKQGYEVKFSKDISVRPPGKERFVRLARSFGEAYTLEAIRRRILTNDFRFPTRPSAKPILKRYRYIGLFPLKKRNSFRALYWHYCCLLGMFPKRRPLPQKQVYFLYREDIRKMQNISEEARLLCKNQIDTMEQLTAFQAELNSKIESLSEERKHLYNKIRRCREEQQISAYKEQIAVLTPKIRSLRRQWYLCGDIAERSKVMKEKMRAEAQTRQTQQEQKRQKGRAR